VFMILCLKYILFQKKMTNVAHTLSVYYEIQGPFIVIV